MPPQVLGFFQWPAVQAVVGFFWVGASIGLGSAAGGWLPPGAKVATPLCMAAMALLGYYLFVRVVERRPVAELLGPGVLQEALAGFLIGMLLFGLVIAVLYALGLYTVDGVNPWTAMLPGLFAAVMAGVAEEILMRGLAFRFLERWLGSVAALAITAAVFGLLHLPNPAATIMSSAAIALEAGILLGAAFMATRRLWLAIGIHAAWNFTQSGIFGVATSGFAVKGWLQGRLQGPTVLSGGAFGPEASVVAVVICLAAGVAMFQVARRRGHVVRRARG
jgi:membrane protease YdiL (CAAX protease family)